MGALQDEPELGSDVRAREGVGECACAPVQNNAREAR